MTKPKTNAADSFKLEEKRIFKNGVKYEHWYNSIDNEHHIHLPDKTLIIFTHEDCEGGVQIVD